MKRFLSLLLFLLVSAGTIASYAEMPGKKDKKTARTNVNETEKTEEGNLTKGEGTISLVVSGSGATKDEAVKVALRSAIEETFGTFVSANSTVVNDELVRDEIASISSGNIQGYKVLNSINANGAVTVSVQAVVSINQLVSYAKNKGMSTELSGATFAMNKKMRSLNKSNELSAMYNLQTELVSIYQKGLYDYEMIVGDPHSCGVDIRDGAGLAGYNIVPITVNAKLNDNGRNYWNVFCERIERLALSETEVEEYKKAKEDCYSIIVDNKTYYLRNNYIIKLIDHSSGRKFVMLTPSVDAWLTVSLYDFRIKDNLGHEYSISNIEDEHIKWTPVNEKCLKSNTNRISECSEGFEYKNQHCVEPLYLMTLTKNGFVPVCYCFVTPETSRPGYFGGRDIEEIQQWWKQQSIVFDGFLRFVDVIKEESNVTLNAPQSTMKLDFKAIYSDADLMKLQNITVTPNAF